MSFRSHYLASLLTVFAIANLPQNANAIEQLVDLTLLGDGANRLNATVSVSGFSDSELTRLTGNIVASIGVDISSGSPEIETILFPEEPQGEISILGDNSPNPSFRLGNILVGRVNVDTQDLRVSVSTIDQNMPSIVTNGTYSLDDHKIQSENGIITAQGSILLVGEINETIDLAQTPLEFMPTGTGMIELTEIADEDPNDFVKNYEVFLSIPVDVSQTFEVTTGVDATFTLVGTDPMDEDIQAIGTIAISFAPDGDYNNDGVVDLADYTVWRNNLGAPNGTLPNDPLAGSIGVEQYNIWKQNFGATAPIGGAVQSATVPEPSVLAMMIGSLALLGIVRRR